MADEVLPLSKLKELYASFDIAAIPGWQAWYDACVADVEWAQNVTDEELRTPKGQQRLWSLKGIASLGQGEHLDASPTWSDAQFVDFLCSLRTREWPSQVGKRAREIQAAYDNLMSRLGGLVDSNRPRARLHRAMFALLPHELHVGISWDGHRMIRRLLVGQPDAQWLQSAALARERLRQALGSDEADLSEDIKRSLFCWWLYENGDSILKTGKPKSVKSKAPRTPDDDAKTEVQPLILLPYGKQYKGMFVFSGMLDGIRDVVQASMGGRTLEDLAESLRTEYDYTQWSSRTARTVVRRLLGLGLLKREDGLYFPSEEGDRFLEDEPSVFIEALFVRVYGFAQAQRLIENQARTISEVGSLLRQEYPKWTSDWTASDLIKWGEVLGLSTRVEQGFRLTDYGRSWIARLPETLPKPPPGSFEPERADALPPSEAVTAKPPPTFEQVWAAFQEPPHNQLIFTRSQVRALHTAWTFHPRKRFAILSGLSGTGKTELLLTYSHVICELMELEKDRHVRRVAVSPDWRDPTGLLGYFNALHAEPTFQAEPALRIVLDAVATPGVPFFLVLDEMNLARVERYFAPFLSAMESDKDSHIQLHAHGDFVNDVPPSVPWPKNLRIGGTVNMDETTHPFSDKVLDRAFTLEFWQVDLPTYFAARPGRTNEDHQVEEILLAIQEILRPIRRHFGYRSAGEVLAWVRAARESDGEAASAACVDQALFSKILPRLRGAQTAPLEDALRALAKLCDEHELPLCRAKVDAMEHRLRATGVTGFWS